MGLVVFSDLDGTLLDHHDYSWRPARHALEALKRAGGELVFCSSKTRAEMLPLHAELGLKTPMIAENGGGIFVPVGHPLAGSPGLESLGEGWLVMRLGMSIDKLRQKLGGIKDEFGARGFGDLSDREVAELTGLGPEQAALARQREFCEPVLLTHPERDEQPFIAAAWAQGLEVTRGGRFFQVLGGGDKGDAVVRLSGLYRQKDPKLLTMGLGDAPNDEPMLAQVDHPVQVARPDGGFAPIRLPGLMRTAMPGPEGWNAAVLSFLRDLGAGDGDA